MANLNFALAFIFRGFAEERNLVAAIQFEEHQEDEVGISETVGFETFKANERQTSEGWVQHEICMRATDYKFVCFSGTCRCVSDNFSWNVNTWICREACM